MGTEMTQGGYFVCSSVYTLCNWFENCHRIYPKVTDCREPL